LMLGLIFFTLGVSANAMPIAITPTGEGRYLPGLFDQVGSVLVGQGQAGWHGFDISGLSGIQVGSVTYQFQQDESSSTRFSHSALRYTTSRRRILCLARIASRSTHREMTLPPIFTLEMCTPRFQYPQPGRVLRSMSNSGKQPLTICRRQLMGGNSFSTLASPIQSSTPTATTKPILPN